MQEFNAADCGQNTVEEVEDRLVSADQRAFATCGIEWSAQRRILGLRSLRHVFRRDAIEVRFILCCRELPFIARLRILALAELAGSPDSSGNFRHRPVARTAAASPSPVCHALQAVTDSANTRNFQTALLLTKPSRVCVRFASLTPLRLVALRAFFSLFFWWLVASSSTAPELSPPSMRGLGAVFNWFSLVNIFNGFISPEMKYPSALLGLLVWAERNMPHKSPLHRCRNHRKAFAGQNISHSCWVVSVGFGPSIRRSLGQNLKADELADILLLFLLIKRS